MLAKVPGHCAVDAGVDDENAVYGKQVLGQLIDIAHQYRVYSTASIQIFQAISIQERPYQLNGQ